MNPGRVIVVTGLPGAGKSTLARELASRYRVPVLAKDFIKEPLLDVLGAADAAESRQLSDASFAVLFRLAAEWVRGGHGFILEGNFRPGEHEGAIREALTSGPLAQVLCRVPEAERLARITARQYGSARHAGHRVGERASLTDPTVAGSAPAAMPVNRGDGFLQLSSERFVHEGGAHHTVLAQLDHWMNLRAASLPSSQSSEPSR
jgi:predicted kinase